MNKSIVHVLNWLKARYAPRDAKMSFSSSGEDLIMEYFLTKLGRKKIAYIDIGAHHPIRGNNTYLFYRTGSKGVLIEPNLNLARQIEDVRPLDQCVNAGVSSQDGEAAFYSFRKDSRNTFSEREARAWEISSGDTAMVSKMPLISLDTLIKTYFTVTPDLVSLDTEGLEADILKAFSWSFTPAVFCVEVVSSSGGRRDDEISSIMREHGYIEVARTLANSIFLKDEEYRKVSYNASHG